MKNLITLAVTLFAAKVMAQVGNQPPQILAQPLKYSHQVCGLPMTHSYSSFTHIVSGIISDTCLIAPTGSRGFLNAAGAFSSRVDGNNSPYSVAVGALFHAENLNGGVMGGYGEAVGIYSWVGPSTGGTWATAGHFECRSRTTKGGHCMGVNIEMRSDPDKPIGVKDDMSFIGVNVQPGEDQTNFVGMQFQNIPGKEIYKHSIDVASTFIRLGTIDGVGFCLKFGGKSGREQLIEFWRGCGEPWATRTGFINMNYASPDVQLNQ